ncbi:hypothetical protein Tco_0374072 [Tanacetum coccineum]
MFTYLKNIEGKKLRDLKNKSFDSIQKMFDRAFKRVNTFVDFRTDLVEGSSKRAGEELEQESTKKKKVDEDKDTAYLQSLMEVIPDEEEVAIDVVPLATKSPTIVDWKIHKEGKNSYFQLIRADRKSQMYRIFSHMLKSFSREDLEDLYSTSCLRINEVFRSILLVIMELLMDKLDDFGDKYQVYGRIVGIKSLFNAASITAAHIKVNAAQLFNAAEGVNAASEEVSTVVAVFNSKWTKGRDSNSLWKSSEISSRSALEILSRKTYVLDKLRLSRVQILWGMYHKKNVDYVELLWEDFIYQIDNKAYKKQEKMYYPRFTKVIIYYFLTQDKTLSWRNKIGMHTSRDDYLFNTLRFVFAKEETQIYGAILHDSLTSPEMKETKAYKTYLGFATGATPPKKAQKFKKPASPKLTIVPVSTEEPTGKSKRVKRPTKKSTKVPARGVVIRETPEIALSKKREKVDVTRGKGIELLSQVALNKDAEFEEVRRKSTRDFHKTHPSGSGAVKIIPSGNDEDDSNIEQDSSGEDSDQENDNDNDKTQSDNDDESNSKHETNENESGSESDQEENEDDKEEVKDEFVKTPSDDSDDKDETKITDKAEGDEDEEMDYTTSQLYDDVDIRVNELVDTDNVFVQEEGTNAAMTNVQQGNENLEILQIIEDAHVTLSTFPQKTKVPVTSSSHSSNLAAKFLNFSYIPYTDAEIVSPTDVHVHYEVSSQQTPTLLTVLVSVIFDSSPVFSTFIPQSFPSFTPPPQQSTSTPPPTTEAINPLSTLPDFTLVFQFNNRVTSLEKEVVELKKDTLHTQVTALFDDHLDARL